eukprot:2994559-Pleurochrysis_carterae.AAC.1
MELSAISTAALPAGVYTYGETTNNAAEVFMHMAYDARRQRSFLGSLMRAEHLVARRLDDLFQSLPVPDPLQ